MSLLAACGGRKKGGSEGCKPPRLARLALRQGAVAPGTLLILDLATALDRQIGTLALLEECVFHTASIMLLATDELKELKKS